MALFPRGVWVLLAALAGLLGLQAGLPDLVDRWTLRTAAPPSASAVAVDFVGNGPISLSMLDTKGAASVVMIRNDSAFDVDARLVATLLDRKGEVLALGVREAKLKPHRASPVKFSVTPNEPFDGRRDARLPAHGVVVLTAKQHKSTGDHANPRSRDLLVPQVQPSRAEMVVTAVGLGAALLVAAFGLIISGGAIGIPPSNTPGWTPQSWSTNLAIGGAVLTAILGITALPAQTHFAPRATYGTFAALFAALVTLAPAVYALLSVGGPPTPARALRLFALAAGVTVWATVGQLGLSALLLLELGLALVISPLAAYTVAGFAALVALLVVVYAMRAIASLATPKAAPPAAHAWALL